jgi:hypothetical protein
MRVACYIDGFNLYHAIDDLDKPHLKWLDVCALAKSLCRVGEDLVKVRLLFCLRNLASRQIRTPPSVCSSYSTPWG